MCIMSRAARHRQYSKDSLHAAIVEIFVHRNARCRYSTVQNWSDNIINLVTKRAKVMGNGAMEWVDGNIGSRLNMKYPACVLCAEEGAKGTMISIAVAGRGQIQDAGAKMIHLAPRTTSNIISKSVAQHAAERPTSATSSIMRRRRIGCPQQDRMRYADPGSVRHAAIRFRSTARRTSSSADRA